MTILGRGTGPERAMEMERWSGVGRALVPGPVARVVSAWPERTRRTAGQVLVLAVLVAASWTFLALTAARHGYFDLRVYYGAINFWIKSDGQIYDYLLPKTGYGFTYPPFAGLCMAPMALMGWHMAIFVNLVMNVGSIFLMIVWFAGPLIERRGWPRWFAYAVAFDLAAVFEPIRETVNFGQVNLILLVMVVADALILIRRGHPLGGIGIGLATAIKLTPGVFIIYLLVTRRWRAAGVATAAAAAATWLAATIAPGASRVFWTDAVWDTNRVGSTAFISNQSINGFVSRLNPSSPSTALWLVLVLVALAIWLRRVKRAVRWGDEPAALALTGIFGCLLSPITWVHHLVWAFPAVAILASHAFGGRRSPRVSRWLMAATVVAYLVLSSRVVWAFEYHYDGFGVIGSNVYVFMMCLFLAGLPLWQPVEPPTSVHGDGLPISEDVPDLVELDRKVTAAFDAHEAGLRVPAEDDSLVETAAP